MLELSEIKKDLQAKEDLVKALQSEAHKLQYVHFSDKRIQWLLGNNFISNLILFYKICSCTPYHSFISEYVVRCRAQDEQHSQEVSRFQEELAEAHSQLQILQKQLDDELAKQPLTHQEVEILSHGQTGI